MRLTGYLRAGARSAVLPYLVSRVILDATALIANRFIAYGPTANQGRGTWLQGFLGWDAFHYLGIARDGYPTAAIAASGNNGYFPLLPLLLRAVGASDLASLALALVLGFVAVAAIAALTTAVFDEGAGHTAAWAASFWPAAFFWSAIYTESLFVALAIASLWAAWRGRPAVAASAGLLAALARPTGFALALPLFVLLARRGGVGRLAAAAPLLGPILVGAYLGVHTGTPLALPMAFFGHGNLSPGRPWGLVQTALTWARYGDWQQLAEIPVFIAAVVLAIAAGREERWRGPAIATSVALLVPPVLAGTISSFARYAMVAFPLYWPLRVQLLPLLLVEAPVAIAWTVFATTGHLTP
ncbi:MAG TPA: mannosyltransferase family protein [Candidatus Dormibacteraeota bacterium]